MISVIIRTIGDNLPLLERAVASVAANCYPDKQLVVVFQGTDEQLRDRVAAAVGSLAGANPLTFLHNPTEQDERARNLNLGIKASDGRYIAFLDDDDYLDSQHYTRLVGALKGAGATMAWCLATLVDEHGNQKTAPFAGRYTDRISMTRRNFITINSFVVDRHKLAPELLRFDEELILEEDYAFLLPIYTRHKCVQVEPGTSYYMVPGEVSNTFAAHADTERMARNCARVRRYKKRWRVPLHEQVWLRTRRILGLARTA